MFYRKFFAAAFLFLIGASQLAIAQAPNAKIQGAWKVVEVTTTGPNAATNKSPQPGLYIFTGKHYSVMRVTSDAPRPDPPSDLSKATAAELLALWNPFNANAGTYEIVGGKLITHPIVAKSPTVMASNSKGVNAMKLEGNTLWLTLESGAAGPVANPTTVKLSRVE